MAWSVCLLVVWLQHGLVLCGKQVGPDSIIHTGPMFAPATPSHPDPQVDGQTHVLHTEEAPQGTRLVMDTLSCLIAKEADPSRIIAQVGALQCSRYQTQSTKSRQAPLASPWLS